MRRGDIYYANLDPTIGSEIKKKRPVLIVSNNANNRAATTLTIVPITSNVTKVYPFEIFLDPAISGLQKPSKAQCHQVRTISKLRVQGKSVGRVDGQQLKQVDEALKLHLDLF